MNRGVDCLGVSEIDINPRGRGGEVCAQGPPSAVHALPGLDQPFSATLGVWGEGGGGTRSARQSGCCCSVANHWTDGQAL